MAILSIKNIFLTTMLVGVLAGALPVLVSGQNCNCAPDLCCSQYGYCGNDDQYCGIGCREGPCYNAEPSGNNSASVANNGASVADIVTESFFNQIISQAEENCTGKNFYTRSAFIEALKSYSGFASGEDSKRISCICYNKRCTCHTLTGFGTYDSRVDRRREIAAFFAHVTDVTGHFCYIEAINGENQDCCDETNTQYPCNPNVGYFGRGPLQLSWNYNYGPAGNSIGFDGLNDPGIVASDAVVSFKTALWFWMNNVHSHMAEGFGETIRAINPPDCDGRPDVVNVRIRYYNEYCSQLGVGPGSNQTC